MDPIEFPSPDGRCVLRLEYEDEIRFGPAFYRAILDGRALERRCFGRNAAWSDDGTFCALQLWNSTRESAGPDTSLFLIRVPDWQYYDRPRLRGGWLRILRFEGSMVLYAKDRSTSRGTIEKFELDPAAVTEWRDLFPASCLP